MRAESSTPLAVPALYGNLLIPCGYFRPQIRGMRTSTLLLLLLSLATGVAHAQQVPVETGSIVATVRGLKPGQYVWAPDVAPAGPMLLIVNLRTQRALVYRNGIPIAATTVSTGRPGRETPTGVFTILQKHVEHYSTKYDNAPMPYMERLTWQGIALHAGQLPGYPASHGCIRLPRDFARLLYGVTTLGMTVVVTDQPTTPRLAAPPAIAVGLSSLNSEGDGVDWHPEKSPAGPVSIVVSSSDKKAIVIRNGVVVGSAPVTIDGPVEGSWAYALRDVDQSGQHWMRMPLSGSKDATAVGPEEWRRFRTPDEFRREVAGIVSQGTTVVITTDSLAGDETNSRFTVMEGEPRSR